MTNSPIWQPQIGLSLLADFCFSLAILMLASVNVGRHNVHLRTLQEFLPPPPWMGGFAMTQRRSGRFSKGPASMKLGIIFVAFAFGCIATAFIRVAPDANADNANQADPVAFTFSSPGLQEQAALEVAGQTFGQTKSGENVQKFVCTNSNGMTLELLDYGATVSAVKIPNGEETVNVVLSCNDMAGYEACTSYFGSTVGRYCNRIAHGKFSIDGKEYTLATDGGPHHLHGGAVGFDKKIWKSELIQKNDAVGVRFELSSPDGDEGYPGTVKVIAEYTLDDDNQVTMFFQATTDTATHVNICNHAYWNMAGAGSGSVAEHEAKFAFEKVLEFDDTNIPTGKILPTAGDDIFDYAQPRKISVGMAAMPTGKGGYDHCFVVKRKSPNELALAGMVRDPKSGRSMTVYTTQPGMQFYTSNHFDGQPGCGGFEKHGAYCLETQGYPDSPNQSEFPTTLLKPEETMSHKTVHKFEF